jgi:hypothetical protein
LALLADVKHLFIERSRSRSVIDRHWPGGSSDAVATVVSLLGDHETRSPPCARRDREREDHGRDARTASCANRAQGRASASLARLGFWTTGLAVFTLWNLATVAGAWAAIGPRAGAAD